MIALESLRYRINKTRKFARSALSFEVSSRADRRGLKIELGSRFERMNSSSTTQVRASTMLFREMKKMSGENAWIVIGENRSLVSQRFDR